MSGNHASATLNRRSAAATGKLHLFPSCPADWDVDFKLHAPGQTIVEGVLKGGKLESLKVTPESRAKDIVNWLGKETPYVPPTPGDTQFENPKPSANPPPALSQGKKVTTSSQFNQPGYEGRKSRGWRSKNTLGLRLRCAIGLARSRPRRRKRNQPREAFGGRMAGDAGVCYRDQAR